MEYRNPIRKMETDIDDWLCDITPKPLLDRIDENTMSYLWRLETQIEIMVHEEIYSLIGESNV